jgi:hypothetical protein
VIEPKFELYDKVVNPQKPGIVCIVADIRIIYRDTPEERAVYTVTYDKNGGGRGVIHNVEENRMALHQEKLL